MASLPEREPQPRPGGAACGGLGRGLGALVRGAGAGSGEGGSRPRGLGGESPKGSPPGALPSSVGVWLRAPDSSNRPPAR